MQHSTNVLWKLNAKGVELLQQAGIVSTTYQSLAPNESQHVSNLNNESTSSFRSNETLTENLSTENKTDLRENVNSIIDQKRSQSSGSETDLHPTKEILTNTIQNISNNIPEQVTASDTTTNQTISLQGAYSNGQKTSSKIDTNISDAKTGVNNNLELMPITNWHLRKKKADIFIEDVASVTYLEGLKKFLTSKGIKWQLFDPIVHYLPYDLLLITHASFKNEGDCAFLEDGKAQVWNFLKQHFNLS